MSAPALALAALLLASPFPDPLQGLAARLFEWRAATQPFGTDDVPRVERPDGLRPSWSRRAVAERQRALAGFEAEWRRLGKPLRPAAREVDRRLLGSALARARFELTIWPRWRRDPTFYVEQALCPLVEALVAPPPLDVRRAENLLVHLDNVPALVADARANLEDGAPAFAALAEASLAGVGEKLARLASALTPLFPPGGDRATRLATAAERAAAALVGYRAWLAHEGPRFKGRAVLGSERYRWYLRKVALVPEGPGALLAASAQEWERAVAAEAVERERNRTLPELPFFRTLEEQSARTDAEDRRARVFLEENGLLTVPLSVGHYTIRPLPPWLRELADFGAVIDFTGPSRLGEDSVRWTPPPSPDLGYFSRVNARDPGPVLVHEGVPGHHLQLALAWAHPDPIRRHPFDPVANEGIAFYAEELLLQAGFFDGRPRSRELLWGMARLRAARVEVDVALATGRLTVEQAAARLAARAPMDLASAREEAAFFATVPGQALSYQVGKLSVIRLAAEARARQGGSFDLRAFHDWLWMNGNVPPALLRHELLGDGDVLVALDEE